MVVVEAGEGRGRASREGSAGSEGKQRSAAIFTGFSHSHKSSNSHIRALGTGNYKTNAWVGFAPDTSVQRHHCDHTIIHYNSIVFTYTTKSTEVYFQKTFQDETVQHNGKT